MQQVLTLASLAALDGGAAGAIIEAALREAVADLDDRGADKKARQVVVTVSMVQLENGQVSVEVDAQARLPKRRTAASFCRLQKLATGPGLSFQEFAPQEPDQRTLDEYLRRDDGQDG